MKFEGLKKFIVELVDPVTACVVDELTFETDDIDSLRRIVDVSGDAIHPGAVYELEENHISEIEKYFSLEFGDRTRIARLRSWRKVDELPYRVHTNRELLLMLKGEKPFSAFSESYPSSLDYEIIPESFFDTYVKSGLFKKREHILDESDGQKARLVMYSLDKEEWRIDAYILLKKISNIVGWSEGFERMEGSLLGYSDEENDVYINMIYRR